MSSQIPLNDELNTQLKDILDENAIDLVSEFAEYFELSFANTLIQIIGSGIAFETVAKKNKEKKERSKERKEIINNNIYNNKNKKTFSLLKTNKEQKLPPLEAKAKAKANKKKKPKVSMPKKWVEDRDNETITDQILIDYAEKKGYDWYGAKEMFLEFCDHHLKLGNKWADWYRAYYQWIRNDTKWNGKPQTIPPKTVLSYKQSNPIKELFDD